MKTYTVANQPEEIVQAALAREAKRVARKAARLFRFAATPDAGPGGTSIANKLREEEDCRLDEKFGSDAE